MTWVAERPYTRLYRAFFTDPQITRLTIGQKLLLVYYFGAPQGNMIGLYHAPFEITATQTGLMVPTVKNWTLYQLTHWVTYDLGTREILVHNGARANVGPLPWKDLRRKAIERLLVSTHSARLRALFLDLYADWGLEMPIDKGKGRSSEGPSKALQRTSEGPPSAVAVAVAGAGTERHSVASQPGHAPRSNTNPDGPTDGELMGLVRTFLYRPNGKAPAGYNDGRDMTVIRALREQGFSGFDIADAIEGVRLLCNRGELGRKKPGEKLTMRALYNTGHGVRPLFAQAQEAAIKAATHRQPSTSTTRGGEHVADSVARVLDALDAHKPAGQ